MYTEKRNPGFFRSKIFLVGISMVVLAGVALGAVLGALASSDAASEPTFKASSAASQAALPEPVAPSQVDTGNEGEPFVTYTGTGTSSSSRVDVSSYSKVMFRLLAQDAIRPFYDPQFVSAQETDLEDDEYVVGLSVNGDARAYSIGILARREMVNDVVGGVPVLVTW